MIELLAELVAFFRGTPFLLERMTNCSNGALGISQVYSLK